jgi:hemerythrin
LSRFWDEVQYRESNLGLVFADSREEMNKAAGRGGHMAGDSNIFEWDKVKYTTYVDKMDVEHQGLVQLMNQLYQANEKGLIKSQLLKLVDQLGQKTVDHFCSEEKYMEGLPQYKQLVAHKKIHANLLENFQKHAAQFRSGSESRLPREFFTFLKVWLSAHICGVDRKYGEVAKAG